MFKLIWSAILGGNPASWAILGLGATLLLSASFGAGFYAATSLYASKASTAVVVAVKQQEKHDQEHHANAVVVSNKVDAGDAKHQEKVRTIIQVIHDQPDTKDCTLSDETAKSIDDAGRF